MRNDDLTWLRVCSGRRGRTGKQWSQESCRLVVLTGILQVLVIANKLVIERKRMIRADVCSIQAARELYTPIVSWI